LLSFSTRDTVAMETPARSATALMEGGFFIGKTFSHGSHVARSNSEGW
jgi:hypothetical protein